MNKTQIGEGGCDEECNWKFLGNWVDHKSNSVDNKIENLVAYVLYRILQQMRWRSIFVWSQRYPGTKIDVFDSFAEILFKIKIDVGNRADKLENNYT